MSNPTLGQREKSLLSGGSRLKQPLQTLDGMRGIAAISVLLFHLGHWLDCPWLATNSSLSVDLFFCLSGYVLPLAYWSRRETISDVEFFRLRAIRLMPLIALGALVSLAYVLLKARTAHLPLSLGVLAIAAMSSLLNIPTAGAPHEIGGPMVFPLNGPQYTLFLEFVANLIWWALRKHGHWYMLLTTVVVSAILVYVFGLGGDTVKNFLLGFPRVALSFGLGLGLYYLQQRYTPPATANLAIFSTSGLVTLTLFYWPSVPTIAIQVAWIIIVAPLLVLSGTRLALPGPVAKASLLLGALSYPIYALHYPIFCWVNGLYRSKFGAQNIQVEAPLTFAAVIIGSYLALCLFDEPVRRWLTGLFAKLGKGGSTKGSAGQVIS
jgi:peptidoglycan/LPS O-acetylase OafA/YrhL